MSNAATPARPRPRPSAASPRRPGPAIGPAIGRAAVVPVEPVAGVAGVASVGPVASEPAAPAGDQRLPVSEFLFHRAGAASPFGDDLQFPLPAGALTYRHPC